MQSLSMSNIDKTILQTSNKKYRTGNLLNSFDRFQFSNIKLGYLFFPKVLFNIFLDAVDDSID